MRGEAASSLAPRCSPLATLLTLLVNLHSLNHRESRAPKTAGRIQNPEDFFGAGIAGVPPKNCLDSGLESGARVRGGNWERVRSRNAPGQRRDCLVGTRWAHEKTVLLESMTAVAKDVTG
jgi:hypothetical protein